MKRKAASAARPRPEIEVIVEEPNWRKDKEALGLIRRAARVALRSAAAGRRGARLRVHAGKQAAPVITILLADDGRLRELNRDFRGRNRPTNVLSFPSADAAYLGDIALAYRTVEREARAQRKRFSHHAAHLALHGVLHLLGYDHLREKETNLMESLEISLLAALGVGDPYRVVSLTRAEKAS